MLIDTHSHLNFNAFKNDADKVIKRALDNDIWLINVGSQYDTSKRAVEIAEKYPEGVYAAIGLHPLHLESRKIDETETGSLLGFKSKAEEFDYKKYKELASSAISKQAKSKVVAIGEIGLDYYWKPKTKEKLEVFKGNQKDALLAQLDLAKELNLPVIFHCRMAHDNLIEILQRPALCKIKGVIHCFTGTWEQAQKYLEMGFYLGFNGIIFKLDLDEIIEQTPLDKILIETDCPYLTPPLHVKDLANKPFFRNEPMYIKYTVAKIAKLKNLSIKEISKITTENAKKLFKRR